MKTLKALKGHTYGQKFQKAGDIYDARDSDANLMVLLKNSEYYVAPPVKAPARPKAPAKPKAAVVTKPAGTYNRRDMKAE